MPAAGAKTLKIKLWHKRKSTSIFMKRFVLKGDNMPLNSVKYRFDLGSIFSVSIFEMDDFLIWKLMVS